MEHIETKCRKIYQLLSQNNNYPSGRNPGTFKNLERLNISYKTASTGIGKAENYRILSYVHFDTTHTEFLPDGLLFWNELPNGEYERIVNILFDRLTEENK